MKTHQTTYGLRITECSSVKDIRSKVDAFQALYDEQPRLTVSGWFECAKAHETIFLNSEVPCTVGRRTVGVDLGSEGLAYIGADQIHRVTFYLRAERS